jgi:hypothetical protein
VLYNVKSLVITGIALFINTTLFYVRYLDQNEIILFHTFFKIYNQKIIINSEGFEVIRGFVYLNNC